MRRPVAAAFILALLLVIPSGDVAAGPAFQFTLSNNWATPSFGVADLSGGAGTNFLSSSWTSAANAAELEVKGSSMTGWNITVHKVDSAGWATTNLRLDVQRTGNGAGGATLSGGTAYQEITSTDTWFFRGVGGDKKNIPLQYQIRNISVALGAATFRTTVYYTVTEY